MRARLLIAWVLGIAAVVTVPTGIADAGARSSPPPGAIVVGTAGPSCPSPQYATIPAAVAAANAGDTIFVCAGTYSTTVIVDKSLRILGAQFGVDARTDRTTPSAESIVDSPTGGFIVQGGISNVTIDGFTIQNAGTPVQNNDGIDAFAGGSGYTFINNIIANNSFGINFSSDGTTPTLIEHNRFVTNNQTGSAGGTGVFISNGPANNTAITENAFVGNDSAAVNTAGDSANFSVGLAITNNTSDEDATFVVVVNANGTVVSGNVIRHASPVDPTAGSAIFIGANTIGVHVTGNAIQGGAASGIRVTDLFGATPPIGLVISGNTVRSRLNGIRYSGNSTSGTITHNTVTANSNDGILIESGNSGLAIDSNVATGSATFDCEDDTTGSGTAGTANTWTDNAGVTQRPVGICQTPASTTTLSVTPPNPSFGQPVTLTAHVTCTGGTAPTGTVTFFEGTTALGTSPLTGAGDASLTVDGLPAGAHSFTARYNGDTNCAASTSNPVTVAVGCRTISGIRIGPLLITRPTCLAPGTHVFGPVTVAGAAASLDSESASIVGPLTVTGGTGLRVCASNVAGLLTATGVHGVVVVGDAGDDGTPACGRNNVAGPVRVAGNTGFVEVGGNRIVGPLTVDGNVTTTSVPPENAPATEIEANLVFGFLTCTGNTPPPTNDGHPNTVIGFRAGQCATL
jgi:hypothetical protein